MEKPQLFFLYTPEEPDGFHLKESWVVKAQDRSDALVKLLPKLFLGGRTIRCSKHRELFLNDFGSTLERKVIVIPLDVDAPRYKRFAFLAIGTHGVVLTETGNRPEKTEQMVVDKLRAEYGSTMLEKFVLKGYRII